MFKSISMLIAGVSLACLALTDSALAGTALTVNIDRSQLLELTSDPGTVVVGNPSIADVSINGRQLFINGHSAGETNLMVFDQGGNKIGDYDLSVAADGANAITVFAGSTAGGASRLSYVCAPVCQRAMVVGDSTGSLNALINDNNAKTSFAQGVKSATAPATMPSP